MVSIVAFPKCWLEDICEGRLDLFEWFERSVQLKCEGLELYSGFLASYESHYLRKVRQRTETLGMTIPMMCYSPDFTIPDRKARDNEVEKQIEIINVTAELGGKYCRTLSGQARPEVSKEQGLNWVVNCIEACLPFAEKAGVYLVIENHFKDGYWKYKEFAQKREVFLNILKCINSPWFGVQYDPSNALVAGEDPLVLLDSVLPRIMTVHASDRYLIPGTSVESLRQEDGTLGYPEALIHGVVGQGTNDYDTIFSRLASVGFNGWISIEDGLNGMEEMAKSVSFLKKLRSKYFE